MSPDDDEQWDELVEQTCAAGQHATWYVNSEWSRACPWCVIDDLRDQLAEFERTRSTGGPAPAETRNWGNEQHVPPPESAARADMAPPTRYGASNQKRSKP